jgi:glycosyltransferase involved in cell wall biosynthesis
MTANGPRLSIGLPVYNGEDYLEESLEAILGQTYSDFELVISSNASTDKTDEICRQYQADDARIRFYRQETNIGAAPNHNFVFAESRGELFKWISADDLYAGELLGLCVALLDEHADAILAHSWTAAVDSDGTVIQALKYPLATDSPAAPERFRTLMLDRDNLPGAIRADDFYGVIRSDVLRKVKPLGSFYHSDQAYMAEMALHGRFVQVPDWLYFRRHHAGRALQANPTIRSWCANLDPKRQNRLLNPAGRLVGEYVWSLASGIRRAGIESVDRRACYRVLRQWATNRIAGRIPGRTQPPSASMDFGDIDDDAVAARATVPGHKGEG